MCLILFAVGQRPDLPLVVAANRDEFHGRAAAPLHLWPDAPVAAGRDLQEGGTWLGISRSPRGLRFAAVTNYREQPPARTPPLSRGALVRDFLAAGQAGDAAAGDYLDAVAAQGDNYRGFNLLVAEFNPAAAEPVQLWYWCNRTGQAPLQLPAGVYGLANDALDVPWPKVERGKAALAAELAQDTPDQLQMACQLLLANAEPPPDHELQAQGMTSDIERRTSPVFICNSEYGTRASSVVLAGPSGLSLQEQTWYAGARPGPRKRLRLVP